MIHGRSEILRTNLSKQFVDPWTEIEYTERQRRAKGKPPISITGRKLLDDQNHENDKKVIIYDTLASFSLSKIIKTYNFQRFKNEHTLDFFHACSEVDC